MTRSLVLLLAVALASCRSAITPRPVEHGLAAAVGGGVRTISLVGTANVPRVGPGDLPVGGLSGIAWDSKTNTLWAVSDDRSERGPARLVRLEVGLDPVRVAVLDSVVLTRHDGSVFPEGSIDAEGLARTPEGTFLISSEGDASKGIQPFLREFDDKGREVRSYPLPLRYLVDATGRSGVRDNLGFEGLTLSPDGREILLATENALAQDGPRAGLGVGSPVRLTRLDRTTGEEISNAFYRTEPIAESPRPRSGFAVNGISDILTLDGRRVLMLERSYSDGKGLTIGLWEADLDGAVDVSTVEPLDGSGQRPVPKRLVADLADLGITLDNEEGLAWGPVLPNGKRSLLVMSDDNFSALQRTHLTVLAVDVAAPGIGDIQGRAASSPMLGECVSGVEGVVAAGLASRWQTGFWLVERTGRGLFVGSGEHPIPAAGTQVRVAGCVAEVGRDEADPTRTTLVLDRAVEELQAGVALPRAIVVGQGGLAPPLGVVDDDAGLDFDPQQDALDFWSGLEGSLVTVADPLVVGALDGFGQVAIVADGGRKSGPRTPRGGLLSTETDLHPERIVVAPLGTDPLPAAKVGDHLGPVTGLLEFRFDAWHLRAIEPVEIAVESPWRAAPGRLSGEPTTVASYNTLNLSATLSKERFDALARSIVADLGSPALVALQEIQDDSGPADDGVTTAEATLGRLVDAILAAGGPRYQPVALDPQDKADGGQPGGNIRVALLVDPARAQVVERAGAGDVLPVRHADGLVGPSSSPGRLFVDDPSFAPFDEEGGTRKPLVVEVLLKETRLIVVVCHLASKSSDDASLGRIQPPRRPTEVRRLRQARALVDWLDRLLALDPHANAIVLGDFNDLTWRSPIRLLADAGPLVWLAPIDPASAYSFNWLGSSDLLDHAFVTPALFERARPRLEVVHRNADLPVEQAVSDHDPILVDLDLAIRH